MLRRQLARDEPGALEVLDYVDKPYGELQQALAGLIKRDGVKQAAAAVTSAIENAVDLGAPNARTSLHIAMVRALAEVDLHATLAFGDACLPDQPPARNLHALAVHHRKAGNHERAIELMDQIGADPGADATTAAARRDLRFELAMEIALRETRKVLEADDEAGAISIRDRMLAAASDEPQKWIAIRLCVRDLKLAQGPRVRRMVVQWMNELPISQTSDVALLAEISTAYSRLGHFTRALEVIEHAPASDPRVALQTERVQAVISLARNGFRYRPSPVPYVPIAGRVLYLLHNSLPHDSGGYATRTHGLLTNTRARGWDISGATRLGYPQELPQFRQLPVEHASVVDGVTYFRLPRPGDAPPLPEHLVAYTDAVFELARRERPEILHAAANSANGLVANAVGRALGIKTVYEVRGLWEVTRGSREPDWMESEQFKMMADLEAQAAREADVVVCITRALIDEMVRRGVPADKIVLIPNGVDVARFTPRPRDEALAAKLGLAGKKVIGYIGSIVDYEGLDYLMHAVHRLRERGVSDFGVLIVGDGAVLSSLKELVTKLDLGDLVVFTGRIPHHAVEAHYSIVDIAPFPRRSLPVTEMVSPLKPFEAMAMDKIVIASSVSALGEMIETGVNGFVFRKDDVEDLTEVLATALSGNARPSGPRTWVSAHRSWYELTGAVDKLYKQLTHPVQPIRQIDVDSIELTPEIAETLAAYEKHLAGTSPAHLHRDDYARWSHVASTIPARGSLLDVGIGAGQFVNAMAARGFDRIVGVDHRQHSKFVKLRDGFSVDLVDIASLPYRDGEFDVVTCMETIEHLPDGTFERGIDQLRRVCKERLIITVPFREEVLGKGHLRRFDIPDLVKLFPRGKLTLLARRNKHGATFWMMVDEPQGDAR